MKQLTQCPHCSAIWTMEEMDWQECFACGWPANVIDNEADENINDNDNADDPDYDPTKFMKWKNKKKK